VLINSVQVLRHVQTLVSEQCEHNFAAHIISCPCDDVACDHYTNRQYTA